MPNPPWNNDPRLKDAIVARMNEVAPCSRHAVPYRYCPTCQNDMFMAKLVGILTDGELPRGWRRDLGGDAAGPMSTVADDPVACAPAGACAQPRDQSALVAAQRSMVYIASPYSDSDPAVRDARYRAAVDACAALARAGLMFYSPIVQSHPVAAAAGVPTDWGYWTAQDLRMLRAADALGVLRILGWEESNGVAAEVAAARAVGIPVFRMVPRPEGDYSMEAE